MKKAKSTKSQAAIERATAMGHRMNPAGGTAGYVCARCHRTAMPSKYAWHGKALTIACKTPLRPKFRSLLDHQEAAMQMLTMRVNRQFLKTLDRDVKRRSGWKWSLEINDQKVCLLASARGYAPQTLARMMRNH